jgi:hypothetical protein
MFAMDILAIPVVAPLLASIYWHLFVVYFAQRTIVRHQKEQTIL